MRILLSRLLPSDLIRGFLKYCPANDVKKVGKALKNWEMDICGYVGYERCVITAGGVSTDEISPKTMEAKAVPGLYIAGELLDIDGKLNGAGDALQKKIQKKGKDNIAEGFVSATLFVCTGAMAIAGGIESGSQGTWDTYLAKSSIDILVVFVPLWRSNVVLAVEQLCRRYCDLLSLYIDYYRNDYHKI